MQSWMYEFLSKQEIAELKRAEIEERCKCEAQYLLDHPSMGIRKVAREFGISKSQLHRDLHELKHIDDDMYVQCINLLRRHSTSRW